MRRQIMERANMRVLMGALLGAATVVLAGTWFFGPLSSTGHSSPDDARRVALGEIIYRQHCMSCHGANLEGQPNWQRRKPDGRLPAPPHDQTGHTWHHSDDQLFRITKLGLKPPIAPEGYESDMPAFGTALTDEQIRDVLAYIESRWPAEIQARRNRRQ